MASSTESIGHSFVIRIWLEEVAGGPNTKILRGHIIHVPGDEQMYFKDLEEILPFIRRYLRDGQADAYKS